MVPDNERLEGVDHPSQFPTGPRRDDGHNIRNRQDSGNDQRLQKWAATIPTTIKQEDLFSTKKCLVLEQA